MAHASPAAPPGLLRVCTVSCAQKSNIGLIRNPLESWTPATSVEIQQFIRLNALGAISGCVEGQPHGDLLSERDSLRAFGITDEA